MYRILEYNDEYKDIWNSFAKENGNIFHLIEWKKILEQVFGYKSLYLLLIDEDNKAAGLMPFILGRNLLLKKVAVSMPFVNYLDLCARDEAAYRFMLDYAKAMPGKYGTDYAELRLMVQKDEASGELSDKSNFTFILPLEGGEEKVLSLSSGSNRNHIKKAIKNGWFTAALDDDLLPDFYKVYCSTVKRLGSPAPAYGFFEGIKALLHENTAVLTVKDSLSGKVIGGMFLFLWKDTVYYYWGGALTEYNKKYVNSFMYWEAARFAISRGYKYLDLGRSPLNSGTYKFKEQWGAESVQLEYYRYNKDGICIEDGVKKENFSFFISMWKHIPEPFTRYAGKHLVKYIMP